MPVTLAIRPEKIEISKERPSAHCNVFTGKVKEIAYFGSYNTFIVAASDGRRIKIMEANTSHQELSDITWDDDIFFWWDDRAGVVLRA
jgi:putrescine transport system ATP-binding protein